MTKELGVPIRNHTLVDAMKFHNLLEVEIGYVGGIMGGVTRNKVSILENRSTTTMMESLLL